MGEDFTIVDLDAPAKKAAPRKRPAKKAAPRKAAKKAPPKPPPPVDDGLTVVDLTDPEPEPKPEPAPQFGEDDAPPYLEGPDGRKVNPKALTGVVIDPPLAAYHLKVMGKQWYEIAAETGYQTGAAAQEAVEALMRRAATEQGPGNRAIALQLSVVRHETFMSHWWDKGTRSHDLGAAAVISRELAQLDKIQRVGEIDAQAGQSGPRIVIAGTEEDYVRGLQEVFAAQHSPKELPPARGETIDG